jgi:hypothetical protein
MVGQIVPDYGTRIFSAAGTAEISTGSGRLHCHGPGPLGGHLVERDVGALEDGREQPDELGARAGPHHRDVEQPVGVDRLGADQHSAAVTAGVAERREGEVGDDLALAVEDHPKRQRVQPRELGNDRQVVAHAAVRPAHPVDPVADQ